MSPSVAGMYHSVSMVTFIDLMIRPLDNVRVCQCNLNIKHYMTNSAELFFGVIYCKKLRDHIL